METQTDKTPARYYKVISDLYEHKFFPYIETLPEEFMLEAMGEWFPQGVFNEEEIQQVYYSLFLPWFFFKWIPTEEIRHDGFDSDLTIAENYFVNHEGELNEFEKNFIKCMGESYYSLYQMHSIIDSHTYLVEDLILGTKHQLTMFSDNIPPSQDEIIFGNLLQLDSISFFVSTSPYALSPHYRDAIIQFKEHTLERVDEPAFNLDILLEVLEPLLFDFYFQMLTDVVEGAEAEANEIVLQ